MAYITFYDCTETDKQQITNGLKGTDHHWDFIDGEIGFDNLKPDSEVISTFVSSAVTAEMIEKLPKLKLIACRSTGFNNIDLAAAEQRGVIVTNVPTYGEYTVAEYSFALLLHLSRAIGPAVQAVQNHKAAEPAKLRGFDLHGKTIGIVGTGKIGQQIARIANGFNMHVVAYDLFPKDELATDFHFTYVGLDELLSNSDIISLHVPYSPENHHFIDESKLRQMRPSAIILNTARGELIDTKALLEALKDKRLAGAGLDVLEGEKLLDTDEELQLLRSDLKPSMLKLDADIHELAKLPNVIITPHNAYNSIEAVDRINQTTCQNIIKFWYGETPNKVVVPPAHIGKLIVVRHGESEWNAEGKWTGSRDVHLTEKGFHEAALLGQAISDTQIDYAYTSQQIRALETLEGVLDASRQFDVHFERSKALNERDYGDYTGKNKWEVRDLIGQENFDKLRRNWDYPVPNGETLKAVAGRVVPFYETEIVPKLQSGKNVLVVSHGNAIRALIKHVEQISDDDIANVEMPFGNILIYSLDDAGYKKDCQELKINTTPPPA